MSQSAVTVGGSGGHRSVLPAEFGRVSIIPGSMTTHSYLIHGKGNLDSHKSCSHGAGRRFSRKEAKRRIEAGDDASKEEQLSQTGVSVHGTEKFNDELGSAYKDIDTVMQNQDELCSVLEKLTPIAVIKG